MVGVPDLWRTVCVFRAWHSPLRQAWLLGLGSTAEIEIDFTDEPQPRKYTLVKKDGDAAPEKLLLYTGKDAVCGVVKVIVPPGKTLDHTGIKLELIGQIGAHPCCFHTTTLVVSVHLYLPLSPPCLCLPWCPSVWPLMV